MHHHIECLQLGKACLNCGLIRIMREKDQAGSIADSILFGCSNTHIVAGKNTGNGVQYARFVGPQNPKTPCV